MIRKILFTLLIALLVGTVSVGSVSVGSVSAGQDKATVCHKPGTPAQATLEIAAPALDAHLGHGDYEGECQGPESAGCAALNALVPDPQMYSFAYDLAVSGLEFFPGEIIHADITVTVSSGSFHAVTTAWIQTTSSTLAGSAVNIPAGTTDTVSADYTVVAGDNASRVEVSTNRVGPGTATVDAVNISCTPAP